MPKATNEQLKAKGFSEKQFGNPADFDSFLDDVLEDAEKEVRAEIGGDVYSGVVADSDEAFYITQAELGLSIAELWRRRKQYGDQSAMNGRTSQFTSVYADWERNAAKAEERAWAYIEMLGGGRRSGSHLATGTTGTSLFEREKV